MKWPIADLPQDGQKIISFLEEKFYFGLSYKYYWYKYIDWPYEPVFCKNKRWYNGDGWIVGNKFGRISKEIAIDGKYYIASMDVRAAGAPNVISIGVRHKSNNFNINISADEDSIFSINAMQLYYSNDFPSYIKDIKIYGQPIKDEILMDSDFYDKKWNSTIDDISIKSHGKVEDRKFDKDNGWKRSDVKEIDGSFTD